MEQSVRIVGARKSRTRPLLLEIDRFLKLCAALRKVPWLVPKGVYRFRTFEEADGWKRRETIRTLKKHLQDPRP
jgi:hypothetical protein